MAIPAQAAQLQQAPQAPRWSLAAQIAFRFCVVYLGLFCLLTQISGGLLPLPNFEISDPATLPPMRQVVTWAAMHIFKVTHPLVIDMSGSGDKIFDWVLAFCLLVIAVVVTMTWSILDRRRQNYVNLHKWFRLFLRFALAGQMFGYGMAKVIPLQMPFPFLARLLEPFGNFSPMGVLWASVGASPAYETFAGSAEVLAGILLIIPRTTTLGALVCLADSIQIFTLNMTYDVPVKLFSFHLILMCLFLLAPELRRLADFFVLNRAPGASTQPALFATRRANRFSVAVQIIFGILLLGANVYGSWSQWHQRGGGAAKSALYGIWNVDLFAMDGQLHPPLLTDGDRWHRAIFEFPTRMAVQRMDDSFVRCSATLNVEQQTLELTKSDDKNWKAKFSFQRVSDHQLALDGDMDSHKVHMQLQLVDRKSFLLVNRGFHWVQEYPFNR